MIHIVQQNSLISASIFTFSFAYAATQHQHHYCQNVLLLLKKIYSSFSICVSSRCSLVCDLLPPRSVLHATFTAEIEMRNDENLHLILFIEFDLSFIFSVIPDNPLGHSQVYPVTNGGGKRIIFQYFPLHCKSKDTLLLREMEKQSNLIFVGF